MKHHSLLALYAAIHGELLLHPLALLNEEYLETVASLALLQSGASIIQGSNVPGKKWQIALRGNQLDAQLSPDVNSRLRTQSGRGRPKGAESPDLRIILDEATVFRLEIKARCTFGSSRGNQSATLLSDIRKLREGKVDALLLASDQDVYRNLQGDYPGKRGQKGDQEGKALFSRLFRPIDTIQINEANKVEFEVEGWHNVTRLCVSPWGVRVLVVLAKDRPEWAELSAVISPTPILQQTGPA